MINKYYEILDDECTVYNGYGPCEVTIGSAIHPVTLREREKSNQVVENVPIGPPTDDSYMYVLNKNHKMVPINALGELYVGGKGVGLGYVNKSENDGKFIYIPDVHSGILYKTGDIVKWLSNGQVEFYGRKDSQVKINGFRIELSEIDNLLMHHINIEQAKTICVNRRMNNKLICFLRINSMLSEDEIRDYLTEKLPTYMIPGQFRFINEFPISTSGKIDEKRLENLI